MVVFFTDISGKLIGPIFKGQADILLGLGADRLPQNVGNKLPVCAE
jgi:hypothetical protein